MSHLRVMGLLGLLQMEYFWAQWNLFAVSNYSLKHVDRNGREILLINIM
jgi:hypothetical protein